MRLFAYRRFPVAFLFIWLVIIFVAVTYFMSKGPQCDGYANELEAVKLQVRQLAEMNDRLQELVRKNNAKKHTQDDSKDKAVPKDKVFNNQDISSDNLQQQQTISYEREKVRRRIANGAKEVWYFINAQLKKMLADNNELRFKIDDILSYVMNQTHALQIDTQVLGDINGLKEIRHQKLTQLKQMLIQRLDNLQNPADCSKSRRLLCKLNKGCGYGCQMHHAVYCLIVAYATKRTLLLDTNGWRYMPRNGWNGYYKPLSPSCSVTSEGQATQWDGHQDSDLVVYLPISDSITRRPPYLPLAVPKDMSETLLTHHGHPFVWFVGHMMRYLLRWQPTTTNFLEDKKKTLKFEHPIVGYIITVLYITMSDGLVITSIY